MRETLTLRLDPDVIKAAKKKAQADNRTLTNYIETLMIRDLQSGSSLEVIAPPDIRDYESVPLPGETKAERKRRDALFHAILDQSGH
jgi:hypothetical protein